MKNKLLFFLPFFIGALFSISSCNYQKENVDHTYQNNIECTSAVYSSLNYKNYNDGGWSLGDYFYSNKYNVCIAYVSLKGKDYIYKFGDSSSDTPSYEGASSELIKIISTYRD